MADYKVLAEVGESLIGVLWRSIQADPALFALINPGAAWPNKRWPADRFGELATFLREAPGLMPVVVWGPGEELLAEAVISASAHAAMRAPATNIRDLVGLSRAAALVISGDTGPLHIATAVGTPAVGIFGPTDPARNGPWSEFFRLMAASRNRKSGRMPKCCRPHIIAAIPFNPSTSD